MNLDRLGCARCCALVLGATAIALGCGIRFARAQAAPSADVASLPTAVLLSTAVARTHDAAIDSVIHASLEELGVVRIKARPGMDLEAVQLAIDCMGETPQCLHAVAMQSGARILIAPALQRTANELVLTLLYFDVQASELRRVIRRQNGTELRSETLDAVPDALRELFGPNLKTTAVRPTAPFAEPSPVKTPKSERPIATGPLILAGAGVLLVGGGIVAGLMMQHTHQDYARLNVVTETDANAAAHTVSTGRSEALAANVIFAVGASALVASGIWLAVELSQSKQKTRSETALLPLLTPSQLGLGLVHRAKSL